MSVDTETVPSYINIVLDANPKYLKKLRAVAQEEGQNDKDNVNISLTLEGHTFEMDEYYFDPKENEISFSGMMTSEEGDSFISVSIPLSDSVLIDILQYSIKKLNKLKTVMETMK